MRRYDPGDSVSLRYEARELGGELVDASVSMLVFDPDGASVSATVEHTATGIYDVTIPGTSIDELGVWSYEWIVTGAVEDRAGGQFYVAEPVSDRPPLAPFSKLVAKLGYEPEESERDRAEHLLDEASELIRDKAGKTWLTASNALDNVPPRVSLICAAVAFRAFGNPEGLSQRSLGDSSKSYDRKGRDGAEDIYLTEQEERTVRRLAGGSALVVVTLSSPYGGPLLDPWAEATLQ